MAGSEFYDHTSYPSQGAIGSSSAARAEFELIEAGFGKLPTLAGNGGKLAAINAGGTAMEALTVAQALEAIGAQAAAGKDASGGYAGLTGFALNVWNAAKTFKSLLSFSGTANRSHALPDKSGTVALTSDITDERSAAATLTNKTLTNPVINAINATPIGGTTPAAVAATTLSAEESLSTGASSSGGFFVDQIPAGIVNRERDRLLIGDAARYTGNRLGINGYGSSWITTNAASWILKNSYFASSTNDGNAGIGILGASRTAPGVTPTYTNCGVAGLTLNEGNGTFGRAFYGEVMHKSTTGSSVGHEIQVGNYTTAVPVANAYSMSGSVVNGFYLGVESGAGYTIGDLDAAIDTALNPAGAALDIAGGSLSAAYQHWTVGIVFRNGALLRDGSGFGIAMSMAQKHKLSWEIDSTDTGASIWSEVTVNTQRVGLKFVNRRVQMLGDGGRILLNTLDDVQGAGAVNNPIIKNARTGMNVAFGAEGTDANIGVDIYTNGAGVTRFLSHAALGENLRITPPAVAPTDYLTIAGSAGGGIATIGTGGASATIDIMLVPKGAGYMRFGTYASSADVACNGYLTIRDAGGTLRKLMTTA